MVPFSYSEILQENSNKFEAPNFVQTEKTWKITINGKVDAVLFFFYFLHGWKEH